MIRIATRRLNITIPEELAEVLDGYRDVLNISGICKDALYREISRLETLKQPDTVFELSQKEKNEIINRMKDLETSRREFWGHIGQKYGFQWAVTEAGKDELQAVVERKGVSANTSVSEEVTAQVTDEAQRMAIAIHKRLASIARLESGDDAPRFDAMAFNLGVTHGARKVWEQISNML